jgi:hypothetical protein
VTIEPTAITDLQMREPAALRRDPPPAHSPTAPHP